MASKPPNSDPGFSPRNRTAFQRVVSGFGGSIRHLAMIKPSIDLLDALVMRPM
jgi:hypothetical protein